MKTRSALCGFLFAFTAVAASATPVLTVGTPANDQLATPTKASPVLGGALLNFDSITPYTTYATTYSSGEISISSPDGLEIYPFSDQSGPNYLYDTSVDGSVNTTISVADGTSAVGFGVADSDGVTLSVQVLGPGGSLGPDFLVNLLTTESTVNPGNGYFVVSDTTGDIYGLAITAASNGGSGLALDDVQIAPTPEPASLSLLGTGLMGVVGLGYARRKQRA